MRRINIREEFISQYPSAHQILKTVTTHHPKRFNKVWKDGKRYLMLTTNHALAIVDGVTHDWSASKPLRAVGLFEIIKKEQA